MLSSAKKAKLISALKHYRKVYLDKGYGDLDESATRLMINHFLTEILCYKVIEEIKTEYMIRGTYADYVVQIKGKRLFLVEVKAFSLELSEKHLRQTRNYASDEGIDWAILTNGRVMNLYRIIFDKPVESIKVFSIDLSDQSSLKENVEQLQYLHRDCIIKKELETLWNKHLALNPTNLASFLLGKPVINYIRKELRTKYKNKFSDTEISDGIKKVITNPICLDGVKPIKEKKKKEKEIKPVVLPELAKQDLNPPSQ
ncbi:MAG: hypothetical protein A2Y71_02410 [Bacteroidetes bacterium RBG_13_42_15]|nr:MAG: hypothetical protein A2Y71_02410 [Bacteroidetes bacterium RBG_13_42_15]